MPTAIKLSETYTPSDPLVARNGDSNLLTHNGSTNKSLFQLLPLTHGSVVWSNILDSRKWASNMLNHVQRTDLLLISGAISSSPTCYLEVLTQLPPLDLRIHSFSLKTFLILVVKIC